MNNNLEEVQTRIQKLIDDGNQTKKIQSIEEFVIKEKIPQLSLFFLKNWHNSCAYSKHINIILNSTDPEANFYILKDLKYDTNERKRAVQNIMDSQNPYWYLQYASSYDMENPKPYEKIILEKGDAKTNYFFGDRIKGANRIKHANVIKKSHDAECNYLVALHYGLKNNKPYEEEVIASKDIDTCYKYAKNIKGADILSLGQVIIDSGLLYTNLLFAKDIKGANISGHQQVIINSHDPEYIYKFAKEVPGADIKLLSQAMAETNKIEWIINFAAEIEGADKNVLSLAIYKTNNPEYNLNYVKKVKDANLRLHEKIILTSDDQKIINEYQEIKEDREAVNNIINLITQIKAEEYNKQYTKI